MSLQSLKRDLKILNINYSKSITMMETKGLSKLKITGSSLDVLAYPQPNGTNKYYLITDEFLGSGTYGDVYVAYRIKQKNGALDFDNPFAAKWYKGDLNQEDKKDIRQETRILSQYYFCEKPLEVSGEVITITSYLKGKTLDKSNFKDLSLKQRFEMIWQVFLNLSMMHERYSELGSIIHADLKSDNALFSQEEGITVIDFGLSLICKDREKTQRHESIVGTPSYFPIEACKGQFSQATDIYMCVSLINAILNGKETYRARNQVTLPLKPVMIRRSNETAEDFSQRKTQSLIAWHSLVREKTLEKAKIPYRLDGVDLHRYKNKKSKDLLIAFLNKMQDNNYLNRPSTATCLRFFTSMNIYFQCDGRFKAQKWQMQMHLAFMLLCLKDLWHYQYKSYLVCELPFRLMPELWQVLSEIDINESSANITAILDEHINTLAISQESKKQNFLKLPTTLRLLQITQVYYQYYLIAVIG